MTRRPAANKSPPFSIFFEFQPDIIDIDIFIVLGAAAREIAIGDFIGLDLRKEGCLSFFRRIRLICLRKTQTTASLSMAMLEGEVTTGTWAKSETAGKIVLTFEDEAETVSCDGSTLVMDEEGMGTLTLKKAA